LQLLSLCKCFTCHPLQGLVGQWAACPPDLQQRIHDGVLVASMNASWLGLEAKLARLVLAEGRNSGGSSGGGGQRGGAAGGGPGSLLQVKAAEAVARHTKEAVRRFQSADRGCASSMLLPLEALALVELGGPALQVGAHLQVRCSLRCVTAPAFCQAVSTCLVLMFLRPPRRPSGECGWLGCAAFRAPAGGL
jgi:hypothetical protein